MSVDEDTELRDLIAQTLEANGCFAKIRAQLRASIYLALDENESVQKKEPLLNNKLKSALSSPDGRIMFQVVRDFLEFYNLNFTLSVYESESNVGLYEDISLTDDLNIPNLDSRSPILLQLIKLTKSNSKNDTTEDTNLKNISHVKNETFEINSPMFEKEVIVTPNRETKNSISEEISERNLTDKSLELDITSKSGDNSTLSGEMEISPPIVKEGTHTKFDLNSEKLKLSPKVKLKDLPPINATKSRTNEMLLPPLYTKELKDMSSQKELEKLFDLEPLDNYEEDFMSESEMDFGNVKMKSFENNSVTTLEEIKNKKKADAENNQEVLSSERNSAKSDIDVNLNV